MTNEEQVEQAHLAIARFVELFLGRLATQWAEENLSVAQIGLLFVLAHADTASVREVAERLHISQSAASLLVDRLVQAHLAERTEDPIDRRRARVRLTPQGEALMGRNLSGQQYLHAWLSSRDDAHLTMIIETFAALLNIPDNRANARDSAQDESLSDNHIGSTIG